MDFHLPSGIYLKHFYKDERFCSCKKSRTLRLSSSCFINAIAVLVFLFCLDVSMGQPQVGQKLASAFPNSPQHIPTQPSQVKNAEVESSGRELGKDGEMKPSSKTLFFGENADGVPIVVGTWFRYGSYTLAFCMFGTGFLASCAAAAIYYVLFVVTEPSQQVRSMKNGHDEGWSVGRILRALQVAYETYESFDPYSPVCQLKTICEIQESGYFEGSLLKRITHFAVHTDLIDKKLHNAAELRAADRVGNDPKEQCYEKFSGCRFSLNKLYESYITI